MHYAMTLFKEIQKAKLVNHFSAFLVFFILLCVVRIGCQNEEVIKTCQKIVIGKVPYSKKDCKKYYQCTAGRPVLKECPSKELFDKNALKCLSSKLVNCGNKQISKTTKSPTTTTSKKSPKTTSKISTTKKSTTKKPTKPPRTTIRELPTISTSEVCVPNKTNMQKEFSLWYEYNGSWYCLANHIYKDDVAAEAMCRSICGTLVVIDNSEEEKFLLNLILGTGIRCFLIGGNDKKNEGRFVLQGTGQPVPYLRWARGQPDGGTFNNCLSYRSDADGMLDASCSFKFNDPCLYVCESKHKY